LPASLFVVGDFKQSIFSFQGADVKVFDSVFQDFSQFLNDRGKKLEYMTLGTSYRSCPEVLKFVDDTFNFLKEGVLKEGETLVHKPFRTQSGKVSVIENLSSPRDVAIQIEEIAKNHPGDIMILFRKRSQDVKNILAHLEEIGVPTTGLDRFELMEEFCILDLLALARVCSNPLEDMAVALTLISPLFFWGEKSFEPFLNRQQPLYMFPQINELLSPLVEKARNSTVLEFYLWLLKERNAQEEFKNVYGENAGLSITAFFEQIRIFETQMPSSIDLFVSFMQNKTCSIKKDMVSQKNAENDLQIRPLTIHASKGLEAKTVIFLDLPKTSRIQDRIFIYQETMFWAPTRGLWPEGFKELRQRYKKMEQEEYNRLRYVAFTRARDNLFIIPVVFSKD
jgi:ATP-dependent helicase/nuclease subunit A